MYTLLTRRGRAGAEVGRIERAGARYLYAMTVNEADSTVTRTGQANRTVTVRWDELP